MSNSLLGFAAGAMAAVVLAAGPALADIKVAATIKPIHSLVAAVIGDTGEPALILQGPASPHVTALRPSQARIIEDSDIVFAVGEGLEPFLLRLMESADGTKVVKLAEAPGIELLDYREAVGDEDAHDGEDDDGHGKIDPHIWLDPANGKAIADHIAKVLSAADPANAPRYSANAEAVSRDLDALESQLAAKLAPVKQRPFLVFHDAYPYFEARFGLNGLGPIVLNPETPPGARRLMEIRRRIGESNAACVFSEPQFEIGYVTTVVEGTDARTAVLDPLGVTIAPGPDAYRQILTELADRLAGCLAAG